MTEREIKLALPGRFTMPALSLDGEPLDVATLPDQQLRATYYDTADLRMARHGVTLRYRTGEAETPRWTLKLPVGARGAELERDELNFEAARREPPPEVRSLVTAYARGEPLTAVATLRTRRRRIHLIADEVPIAEVADDEVSVIEGRRVVSRFRELEVEALTDGVDLAGHRPSSSHRRRHRVGADPEGRARPRVAGDGAARDRAEIGSRATRGWPTSSPPASRTR